MHSNFATVKKHYNHIARFWQIIISNKQFKLKATEKMCLCKSSTTIYSQKILLAILRVYIYQTKLNGANY